MPTQLMRNALLVVALVACKDKAKPADPPKPAEPPAQTQPAAAKPELPTPEPTPEAPKDGDPTDKADGTKRMQSGVERSGQTRLPLSKDIIQDTRKGTDILKSRQKPAAPPPKPE